MASGRQIAACLILVLVALSITACGGDSPQGPKIPASRADDLITKLQEVQDRAADPLKACGDNNSAQTSLSAVSNSVDTLSDDDVDPDIIANLKELIGNVDQQLSDQCSAASTASTTTTTETTSSETTDSTKETTNKSTTTTQPTDATSTSSTKSTTTTDSTNPPETSPPGQSGGGNGGGSQGGFEAGGTAPGGRVTPTGGGR